MDFKSKRLYKKRAKQYFCLAWGLTFLFFLFGMACIIALVTSTHLIDNSKGDGFGIMLLFVSPLIFAMISGIIGQFFVDRRCKYKAQILEYRQRKFFTQTMNLITSGKLNEAIDVYTELVTKQDFRRFLYPFFLNEFLHSTNEDQKKKGEEKLATVLEIYNPNDVKF
ncbi:MAG: hypothetical protein WC428_02220 [Candidatus Paceibacterota bacterium]